MICGTEMAGLVSLSVTRWLTCSIIGAADRVCSGWHLGDWRAGQLGVVILVTATTRTAGQYCLQENISTLHSVGWSRWCVWLYGVSEGPVSM